MCKIFYCCFLVLFSFINVLQLIIEHMITYYECIDSIYMSISRKRLHGGTMGIFLSYDDDCMIRYKIFIEVRLLDDH